MGMERESQNTAIVLKSLGVLHKEIKDALVNGDGLNADNLEKLTKISLTTEEISEILPFDRDPTRFADAKSFVYHFLEAFPSAFTHFDAMLFRLNCYTDWKHFLGFLVLHSVPPSHWRTGSGSTMAESGDGRRRIS
ncbi:formin 4 [Olea europaea subsp. europaea]|uniref:Formin 4 n=1 Tax=Olea europaea subsp. europaea TaxID=158383 RepID=A0A8S0PS89_OLEEU|nr:formin 4 [Olea europaea subsp. europaea]